jgi:hypothetical protein
MSQTIPISPKVTAAPLKRKQPSLVFKEKKRPIVADEDSETDDDEDADQYVSTNAGASATAMKSGIPKMVIKADSGSDGEDDEFAHKYLGEEEEEEEEEEEDEDEGEEKVAHTVHAAHAARTAHSMRYSDDATPSSIPAMQRSRKQEQSRYGAHAPRKDVDIDQSGTESDSSSSSSPSPPPTKKKQPKPAPAPAPPEEDDEAISERINLIDEIKGNAAMGLMPPMAPLHNMPIKLLRQIKRFQEEKFYEIKAMQIMGTGLTTLVGLLENLNGRFDPFGKLFGRGLKLKGAGTKVEEKMDEFLPTFALIYRDMKKKGHNLDVPPWMQIVMITAGILRDVHVDNVCKEMKAEAEKERNDPEALRRANEYLHRQTHIAPQQQQPEEHPIISLKPDAEMEAMMAKEFAGCDKLPSLESIAARRKDVAAATDAIKILPAQPDPVYAEPAKKQEINLLHKPSVDVPVSTTISMTHTAPPFAVQKDQKDQKDLKEEVFNVNEGGEGEEDEGEDEGEEEGEGDDEDEEQEGGEAPMIQIPSLDPKK